jgi:predicted transcriptional regulator
MDQISEPEVKVYHLLSSARRTRWFSNLDIATELKGPRRTVSLHTKKFFECGLLEKVEETFGGARFRWAPSKTADQDYLRRLKKAAVIFLPESEEG